MLRYLLFLLPVLALAPLQGCETYDAVGAADTIGQKTFALYGEFVIAKEAAADIVEQPTTPSSVKRAIVQSNRLATPLIHAARDLAIEYSQLRERLKEAKTDGEKKSLIGNISTVATSLISAYNKAEPDVRKFVTNVNSLKKK